MSNMVHVGQSVLRDLDIDGLVAALKPRTEVGAAALRARLSAPISDEIELQKRQNQIKAIKTKCTAKDEINTLRQKLCDTEKEVASVANISSDSRHAEYYNQILWAANSSFAWLNKISWINEAIVFFRTILLPGLSVVLPLLVFVAPLVFYNLVLKEPLTLTSYFQLLQTSLKKAMPSVLGKPRFAGRGGTLEFGEQFVHVGVSVAMFAASIWNQISAALTMRSVVVDMRRRADAIVAFYNAASALASKMSIPFNVILPQTGQLGLFGYAWNSPGWVQSLLIAGGELDMLAAIALTKRTCFPTFADHIRITDLYHPGLQRDKRIYNSIEMGTSDRRKHVLLTGPNRGGKSTLLKSLGSATLMAQTIGIVFSRSAEMPMFNNIITA